MDSAADVFLVPIIKSEDTVLKAPHIMEVRKTSCFGDAQYSVRSPCQQDHVPATHPSGEPEYKSQAHDAWQAQEAPRERSGQFIKIVCKYQIDPLAGE